MVISPYTSPCVLRGELLTGLQTDVKMLQHLEYERAKFMHEFQASESTFPPSADTVSLISSCVMYV